MAITRKFVPSIPYSVMKHYMERKITVTEDVKPKHVLEKHVWLGISSLCMGKISQELMHWELLVHTTIAEIQVVVQIRFGVTRLVLIHIGKIVILYRLTKHFVEQKTAGTEEFKLKHEKEKHARNGVIYIHMCMRRLFLMH